MISIDQLDKKQMTPARNNAGKPTAVKRNPSDQKITFEGQTGTNTLEAPEQYLNRKMTELDSHDDSHEDSSCSCGH